MECPVCRTSNTSGIKYCIKCGRNLENSSEVNYGQVDRGGYHTEEEYSSENKGFEMSDSVFTVNDRKFSYISPNLFTSAELNNPVEEFDFGGQQETNPVEEFDFGSQQETSSVEEIDFGGQQETGSVEEFDFGEQQETNSVEEFDFGEQQETSPVEEFDFGGQQETNPVEEFDFGEQQETSSVEEIDFGGQIESTASDNSALSNEEPLTSQPYADYVNNSVPLPAPPYKDMYGNSPQIIGYDQNGMPIYAQPSVYTQPQFIGYDQNGMPIYTQPSVYTQSQFIGYDQNGMPIYAQPSVYTQPQFIGYDQNGMPIYAQPSVYTQSQFIGYDQNGMPIYTQPSAYPTTSSSVQTVSQNIQNNVSNEASQTDETTEKFMDFLDDGESNDIQETENDFFGKSSDMGSVDVPIPDVRSLKKRESKKKVYMADVEIKDAENLVPNTASKFNRKYMKQAQKSGSEDLGEKKIFGKKVSMRNTKTVDAEMLNPKFSYKSRIRMGDAGQANPDELQANVAKPKRVTMEEADHAVEAMPKKKKYVDELDLIELPEYMQARKKSKKDDTDFPSMTDL